MTTSLPREQIAARLDITEPFLMIDTFEVLVPGRVARATRQLDADDWFFKCHLPASQVMPATLQIEGMLQTLVLLIYSSIDHGAHRSFVTDVNVRLLSTVKPGQTITYDARVVSFRRGVAKGEVTGTTDGKATCRGDFGYASPHLLAAPRHGA